MTAVALVDVLPVVPVIVWAWWLCVSSNHTFSQSD
jgi:hypothetical protein